MVTNDKVQAETAKAQGISVYYFEQERKFDVKHSFEKFFNEDTMSVHLKEGVVPLAKRVKPGEIKLVELEEMTLSHIGNLIIMGLQLFSLENIGLQWQNNHFQTHWKLQL